MHQKHDRHSRELFRYRRESKIRSRTNSPQTLQVRDTVPMLKSDLSIMNYRHRRTGNIRRPQPSMGKNALDLFRLRRV
jgi:hypothetical protein